MLLVRDGRVLLARHATRRRYRLFSSLFKPIVALAVLRLAEAGLLALDATMHRLGFRFAHARRVTVAALLDHTSGLRDVVADVYFRRGLYFARLVRDGDGDATACASRAEFLAHLSAAAPASPPAPASPRRRAYNNAGYDLLGLVLERVTGERASDAVRRLVLAPLRMTETGFQHERHPDEVAPRDAAGRAGVREQQNAFCGNGFLVASLRDAWRFLAGGEALLRTPEARARYRALYFYHGGATFLHTGSGDFPAAHARGGEEGGGSGGGDDGSGEHGGGRSGGSRRSAYHPLSRSVLYSDGRTVLVAATHQADRSRLLGGAPFRARVYAALGVPVPQGL